MAKRPAPPRTPLTAALTAPLALLLGVGAAAGQARDPGAVPPVAVDTSRSAEPRDGEDRGGAPVIELDDRDRARSASLADLLAGRAPGLTVQRVSGASGVAPRLRIRGAGSLLLSSEPLLVVDGVPLDHHVGGGLDVGGQDVGRIGGVLPDDIAAVEILGGPAATALYGPAAADGAILITTRRGGAGPARWEAFVETARLRDATDYPDNFLSYQVNDPDAPLRDPDGHVIVDNLGFGPGVSPPDSTAVAPYSYCPNRLAAAGSCRQDGTLRFQPLEDERTTFFRTGSRRRYGASVRGGAARFRYFLSGLVEDERGVVAANTAERAGLRANLDAALSETVELGVSVGYTDVGGALSPGDYSVLSPILSGLLGSPFYRPPEASYTASTPASTPASTAASTAAATRDPVNPANYWVEGVSPGALDGLSSSRDGSHWVGGARARWRPAPWLVVRGAVGVDRTAYRADETLEPGRLDLSASHAAGYRAVGRSTRRLITGTGSAVGTFRTGESVDATTALGFQYGSGRAAAAACYGSYDGYGAECGAALDAGGAAMEVRWLGGYLRQELAWKDRVVLAAGVRADDPTSFGRDIGVSYSPSASVTWAVAREPWFPRLPFVGALRLRGAWGATGRHPGLREAAGAWPAAVTPSVDEPGSDPGRWAAGSGSGALRPERVSELELGSDARLFGDRLSLAFTCFTQTAEDIIVADHAPALPGAPLPWLMNLGRIHNAGTELAAGLTVVDTERLGVSLRVASATLDNEIERLGESVEPIPFNRGLQRHAEGYPAGAFFQRALIWEDADRDGRIDYGDVDGNGVVDADETEVRLGDEEYIGPSLPTWRRSMSLDLRLFRFLSLSTLVEGRGGHYTSNDGEAFRCQAGSYYGCAAVADPDASLEAQARYIAVLYLGSAYGYVEKADFYRWRELAITLEAPPSRGRWPRALDGVRITLAGRNLATWTGYSGLDPEVAASGASASFSQSEFGTQPLPRHFMVRVDAAF